MITSIKDKTIRIEFEIGNYNKDLIDLLTMMEITNKSKASETDIQKLSDDISAGWWSKNKSRFLDENSN